MSHMSDYFAQNEQTMKWNIQLLTMRCCIIEGKKFSILPNVEKGMSVLLVSL